MTRYTVTWRDGARDDLATLWLESGMPSAVAKASNAIDQELSVDPLHKGAVGHEGLRQLSVAPLRVQFTIEEDDRVVRVWSVRLTR